MGPLKLIYLKVLFWVQSNISIHEHIRFCLSPSHYSLKFDETPVSAVKLYTKWGVVSFDKVEEQSVKWGAECTTSRVS